MKRRLRRAAVCERRAAAVGIIAAAGVLIAACGADGNVGASRGTDAATCGSAERSGARVRELIADPSFADGCALAPVSTETVTAGGGFAATNVDTLRFGEVSRNPAWQMCQWWSRHDLTGARAERFDGGVRYANAGKCVERRDDGTLVLELDASAEYDAPRTTGGKWPHLLVQQDFPDAPHAGELSALVFGMELRVVRCENRMSADEYDSALHTAQAQFYLLLRNDDASSPDCGKALWVGIPTFDYRYSRLSDEETVHWDEGTTTYIYTVPAREVWGDVSLGDGRRHTVRADILPHVLRALEAMRERGELAAGDPRQMAITGMNFGWEVPGTFDAALEVKNISLAAMPRTDGTEDAGEVAAGDAAGSAAAEGRVRIRMATTMGDIVVELDDRTPRHRDNFAELVREGYFDSLLFHRVIEGFMIQGGDPRTRGVTGASFDPEGPETGDRRYRESIPAEIRFPELFHRRGALAAAREGDDVNPERRSSRTQFYIVWGRNCDDAVLDAAEGRIRRQWGDGFAFPDSVRSVYRTEGGTPHLDGGYTVFGRVVEGLDVVEAIQRTPTDSLDRPLTDVRILHAEAETPDGRR